MARTKFVRRKKITNSVRDVVQCISNTLKKRQCKKRTAHTRKCWIHLAKDDNLRIKPSTITGAGKGLFSWKKRIPRNKFIAKYDGQWLTSEDVDRRYAGRRAEYVLCDSRGQCVDAYKTTHGAARYANDKRGTRLNSNAWLVQGRGNRNFFLRSYRSIAPHKEILTEYGRGYWAPPDS